MSVDGEFTLQPGIDRAGKLSVACDLRTMDCAGRLPFSDAAFDLVILHRVLDRLPDLAPPGRHAPSARDLLTRAARIVASGGIVAGCVENRYALGGSVRGRATAGRLSVGSCSRALTQAGFGEARLFSIVPGVEAPARLLGIELGWSRRACKRHAQAMRPLVAPSSYLVWWMLGELGLSQYLGAATFFWARKR